MTSKFLYFVIGAGALVLFLIVWFVFFENNPDLNRPPAEGNIIFFGDSLVEGVGATIGNDLPSQASRQSGYEILNGGWTGDTAASALQRLERDVLEKNPKLVIVLLGGNDFLTEVPPDETFLNLGEIIDKIQARQAAVLLVGVRGGVLDDPYKQRFEELAKTKNVSYIPNILDGVIGHPDLMTDPVHPNDAGYGKMAERILPALRDILR